MKLTPLEHIAAQRRIIEFYGFHSPAIELVKAQIQLPRREVHSPNRGAR